MSGPIVLMFCVSNVLYSGPRCEPGTTSSEHSAGSGSSEIQAPEIWSLGFILYVGMSWCQAVGPAEPSPL